MPLFALLLVMLQFCGQIKAKALVANYDALNRATVESAQTGAAIALFNYLYSYDLVGNVLTVAETYPGGLNNRLASLWPNHRGKVTGSTASWATKARRALRPPPSPLHHRLRSGFALPAPMMDKTNPKP